MGKRFQTALEMKQALQKTLLALTAPVKGVKKVIYVKQGKPIRSPWWRKTSWVSMPAMTLGLSGTRGTLVAVVHYRSSGDRSGARACRDDKIGKSLSFKTPSCASSSSGPLYFSSCHFPPLIVVSLKRTVVLQLKFKKGIKGDRTCLFEEN